MNEQDLEAFFLNHDDPIFEQIQEAETSDEAEGIAADALADAGIEYDARVLWNMVVRIRKQ